MATVHFWYDVASPWTYLASTQIEALAQRSGATLIWQPMLLGGLFKLIGTPDVPLLAMSDAKRRYTLRDLHAWAAHLDVPLQFSSRFPMPTLTAMRLVLAAGDQAVALSHALFRALWVDDRDLNDQPTLAGIVSGVGLDPAVTLARTQDAAIKQELIERTQRAAKLGIFGAPTFIVEQDAGDLLFWGQDRLVFVERALQGWRPPHG
jgi:2-hydroxychromene-2-carboxylate isomerase